MKVKSKILLTGGSGNLGKVIKDLTDCVAPNRQELDIRKPSDCSHAIDLYNPEIIIHSAAWTDVVGAETMKSECWQTNVKGTENMIRAASGRRFVYISTEYVFDGERGNYNENDIPSPVNFYALTKLIGESIVRQYKEALIIRTAFKPDGPWPHKRAFIDQWMSADFVSQRAPDLLKASLMRDLIGVIHVSGKRKSIYELAKSISPEVGEMSISELPVKLPRDTSLDSSFWNMISSQPFS